MTFHKSNIWLLSALSFLVTACEIYESVPMYERVEKTPIELSIGGIDGGVESRAVITNDPYNPQNFFDEVKATKVFMIMKSTYGTSDYEGSSNPKYTVSRGDVAANSNEVIFDDKNKKYWDDAHARSSQLSIWAYAQKGMGLTTCTFEKDNASGPGYDEASFQTADFQPWRETSVYPIIRQWKASTESNDAQTATTVMSQDLLFSNNLVDNSTSGTKLGGADADKSLKFDFTTRKFPQTGNAVMKFYHAMAKMTINIIEGDGFDAGSTTDFKFKTGTNINFPDGQFNTKGSFSIQEGIFQEIAERNAVPSISCPVTKSDGTGYTLEALAIPNIHEYLSHHSGADVGSRFVNDATNVMMEFTIDNSKYQITSGMLYNALHVDGDPAKALVTNATVKTDNGTYIPLEAGKNYIFTFNVGKTKIKNLTAQVAKWENVEATEQIPSNARIRLNLEERGTAITEAADIYRAEDNANEITDTWQGYDWTTGYVGNGNVFSNASGTWKLTNDWYWPNNTYYYHFRAIMPGGGASGAPTVAEDTDGQDCVALTSGTTYTDIRWGAPFTDVTPGNDVEDAIGTDKLNWTYDSTTHGFDGKDAATKHQINYAIGPTEDQIKLILFHIMSHLEFTITTSATDNNQVVLGDGNSTFTKVELLNYYPNGRLLLGNGLVQTTGDKTNAFTLTNNLSAGSNKCTFGIVPQAITDDLQLRITTPDHNQYYVKLKDVLASTVTAANLVNPYTESDGKYIIDRWYPGYKYNYTLNLLKKGVTDIKATIVEWEEVNSSDDNVQIR